MTAEYGYFTAEPKMAGQRAALFNCASGLVDLSLSCDRDHPPPTSGGGKFEPGAIVARPPLGGDPDLVALEASDLFARGSCENVGEGSAASVENASLR